jgi:epoxyqueuosine reductase
MKLESLREILTEKAQSLGFQEIGFTPYSLLSQEIEKYKEWLASGNNSDMAWMERNLDKREDIRLILPEAKTVIVLAYTYKTPFEPNEEPNSGKIARYAWGTDYHEFIPPKLREIQGLLKSHQPESESKSYVDTGAVLERQWALKAGLGWQGKNSLILNRKLGSYFFLSVIFTTIDFESKPNEIKDYCGKCTKCIDACPTGAISSPKIVDARKCISYWTIEAKADKEIPENIKSNLKGWVYGCDICQEVCPWNNHRVKPSLDELLFPRNNETNINLENIKNMTQEEFSLRFTKSPIKRPKLSGLKRNAEALLGVGS